MVHVYTGDGKGKTTAATGLALRAAGRGKFVDIIQFLKSEETGEKIAVEKAPINITYHRLCTAEGFYSFMEEQDKALTKRQVEQSFELAKKLSDKCGFLILDEIFCVVSLGLLELPHVLDFVKKFPPEGELILTGRDAPEEIIEASDYVSEIKCIKHPYNKGCGARLGVEF